MKIINPEYPDEYLSEDASIMADRVKPLPEKIIIVSNPK